MREVSAAAVGSRGGLAWASGLGPGSRAEVEPSVGVGESRAVVEVASVPAGGSHAGELDRGGRGMDAAEIHVAGTVSLRVCPCPCPCPLVPPSQPTRP